MNQSVIPLLEKAIAARTHLFSEPYDSAFRLFNGFYEGYPDLTLDVYGCTLVIHNYADDPLQNVELIQEVAQHITNTISWLRAGVVKTRNGKTQMEKRGVLVFGDKPDTRIREHGILYAIDLMMNQDASFYLDTSNVRKWLIENIQGKSVLNTFAYTGSLGVAAMAGGASHVIQTDRNRQFLNLAKDSYSLNNFPIHKTDFIVQDFFPAIAHFKSTNELFDCVIIDPPFFSKTAKGKVDLVQESTRLINKVRPLINDGGKLITINNALYVSGKEYRNALESLCSDGYLKIKEFVNVPKDFIGHHTIQSFITDPSPFNHPTKIAVLEVRRK